MSLKKQNILEPEFYSDLVNRFTKTVGKPIFFGGIQKYFTVRKE